MATISSKRATLLLRHTYYVLAPGTNKHVETSGCAFESVFRYLTKDEKKGKSNTGKKQKLPESSEEHEVTHDDNN